MVGNQICVHTCFTYIISIYRCQEVLLDNMILGKNIAKNAALRENVFMMAICIELRIPLFLVGKPGSSKSLAKSIIQDSMQGMTSDNDLMKNFKQVHMFSYQCSQLSTPESVIEVFNTASSLQNKQEIDQGGIISVVVLDEVGLAEDSPNLPLKALHPLLEDGTEGAGAEGEDKVRANMDYICRCVEDFNVMQLYSTLFKVSRQIARQIARNGDSCSTAGCQILCSCDSRERLFTPLA